MLQGWRKLRLWLCLRLRLRVVLFAIDVLRCRVLFPVDLLLLGGRQRSAVGLAVRGNLLVDTLLLIIELGGFTSGQLPGFDGLGDAVVLVFFGLRNFGVGVVGGIGVVFGGFGRVGSLVLM